MCSIFCLPRAEGGAYVVWAADVFDREDGVQFQREGDSGQRLIVPPLSPDGGAGGRSTFGDCLECLFTVAFLWTEPHVVLAVADVGAPLALLIVL